MGTPFTNEEVAEMSRKRLESFRSAGIKYVRVLGCNYAPDECDIYRAARDDLFEIEFAPTLPLPGCDKANCKCILLAVEGPKGRKSPKE